MLGGRPPFEADSAMSVMMMHMSDPPPDLSKIRADISPEMAMIVRKALAKDPADRYQRGVEFAADLREAGTRAAAAQPIMATIIHQSPDQAPEPKAAAAAPVVTNSQTNVPAAAAAVGAVRPGAESGVTSPLPPPASAPPPSGSSGGSRTLLFGAGAVIILLLLAFGIWAAFFRGGGDGQEVSGGSDLQATATPAPEATPDEAATKAAVDAEMAERIETRVAEARLLTAEAVSALATATPAPTEEIQPTATEEAAYSAQITNIILDNGIYNVFYLTNGYTEQLPGMHVHFYFNSVPEIEAGAQGGDGSGWKRYGGPRPFSEYTEADRPAEATEMCIRVANENHTILFDSGNCYPLP